MLVFIGWDKEEKISTLCYNFIKCCLAYEVLCSYDCHTVGCNCSRGGGVEIYHDVTWIRRLVTGKYCI